MDSGKRIVFVDLLRGAAVVVMIMGHSIDSVLGIPERSTEWFRVYDFLRGFTAPVFLFVSGLAFIVATEKRWDEYRRFSTPLVNRLWRILVIFLIGYGLHLPYFSLEKVLYGATYADYSRFFQADVLHCVAASLLLLHLYVLAIPTKRWFVVACLGSAIAVILAAPLLWSADFAGLVSPVVAPYLNRQEETIFPLIPYGTYLLAGVVTGSYYLRLRERGTERTFLGKLAIAAGILATVSLTFDLLPISLLPPHDFWKANPIIVLFRLSFVLLIVCCFTALKSLPRFVERPLVMLGQYSLLVYTIHLVIVYGSAANAGLAQLVGQSLSFGQAWAVGLVVLVTMLGMVRGWKWFESSHVASSRYFQAALASSLLLMFVLRPY